MKKQSKAQKAAAAKAAQEYRARMGKMAEEEGPIEAIKQYLADLGFWDFGVADVMDLGVGTQEDMVVVFSMGGFAIANFRSLQDVEDSIPDMQEILRMMEAYNAGNDADSDVSNDEAFRRAEAGNSFTPWPIIDRLEDRPRWPD